MRTTYEWESGSVAAGAVINSPVLHGQDLSEIEILVDNSDGAAGDRSLTINWLANDGVTVIFTATVACAKGGRYAVMVGTRVSSLATEPTGVTVLPLAPGRNMTVSLSAVGAKAAQVAIYGRR